MNIFARRFVIGLVTGLAAAPLLLPGDGPLGLALGALLGALSALLFPPAAPGRRPLDAACETAALAIPLWALVELLALPLATGHEASWSAAAMRERFPTLPGWMLASAAIGLLGGLVARLANRLLGAEMAPVAPAPVTPTRILILGGGFAGVGVAAELERQGGGDPALAITLVSETNALLFTPMLAEVAASSLEATHISSPLRTALRHTTVVRGRALRIDHAAHLVHLEDGEVLAYDELVVALGAVSNYLGLANVQREAFDFKSLTDAIRIRNHVIDCFERADRERDPVRRRTLTTLVVAGGGFAGAELAGGLNDFARGMLAWYPNIPREDVQVVLVHGGERILNELSEPLALYAQRRMGARGVTFRLKTRVKDARPGAVVLSDGELPTATLVWTAGTAPSPVLRTLGAPLDKRGAVLVDGHLAVPGYAGVWALGDCAAIPNAATGKSCPPTAQFAIREARTLARNLIARHRGGALQAFSFSPLGALCVVGHHTACAEIKGLRFSGLFAWFLWRGIYLGKLPTLERKVRVLVDWVIELFFPRDIVQTIDLAAAPATMAEATDPTATASRAAPVAAPGATP